MASFYEERARVALEVLNRAGAQPVSFRELRAAGVANPAQTIYELELAGHVIEHSGVGVRLVAEADQASPVALAACVGRGTAPRRQPGGIGAEVTVGVADRVVVRGPTIADGATRGVVGR
jgi:hypothetical protein